jgi:ferredoxin-NADP reductase
VIPQSIDLPLALNVAATPTSRIIRLALNGTRFEYHAGQAAWLAAAPDGDLTPYSLASWPAQTAQLGVLEFLVKVDGSSRFGSRVSGLQQGDRVVVQGPVGTFVLPEPHAASRLLFVAGGTGIAPLRSMIHHALAAGVPKPPRLLYSARVPEEFAYAAELGALARADALDLHLTLTGDRPDWVHGRGRIDRAVLEPLVDDAEVVAFLCGPPAMLVQVSATLRELGLDADRIRMETW